MASPRYWVRSDLESGCLVPDSVDLTVHRGVGVPAGRSVLFRRSVAEGRVTVSVIVLVLKVADRHPGLEQRVPVVSVEALLAQSIIE
jgi:hypothetical protein